MDFTGRDIVSIRDLSREEILHILTVAKGMVRAARGEETKDVLRGRISSELFFEPSTRTRLSFESAMKRLGGEVVNFGEISSTSVVKGETLADTVRMIEAYSDVIVVRHPQEGAARLAADFSTKPVINAGDGAGQHPTQTLLDLFTIQQEKGKTDGNRVVLVGDLKYGRTVHSLSYALALFGNRLTFVAPESLQMPTEVVESVREQGAEVQTTADLQSVVGEADVLYVTRIQKERFPDPDEYRKVANLYHITADLLASAKRSLVVMHPLPRVNEISPDVDATPHAAYFRQAFNGVPVRMAILALILGAVS